LEIDTVNTYIAEHSPLAMKWQDLAEIVRYARLQKMYDRECRRIEWNVAENSKSAAIFAIMKERFWMADPKFENLAGVAPKGDSEEDSKVDRRAEGRRLSTEDAEDVSLSQMLSELIDVESEAVRNSSASQSQSAAGGATVVQGADFFDAGTSAMVSLNVQSHGQINSQTGVQGVIKRVSKAKNSDAKIPLTLSPKQKHILRSM